MDWLGMRHSFSSWSMIPGDEARKRGGARKPWALPRTSGSGEVGDAVVGGGGLGVGALGDAAGGAGEVAGFDGGAEGAGHGRRLGSAEDRARGEDGGAAELHC